MTTFMVAQVTFDVLVTWFMTRILAIVRTDAKQAAHSPASPVVQGNDVLAERWVSVDLFPSQIVHALVLSPTCSKCVHIASAFAADETEQRLPLIIVVDAHFPDAEAFAHQYGFPSPVLAARETGLLQALKVTYTPQLLRLNRVGEVEKALHVDSYADVVERVGHTRVEPGGQIMSATASHD